jgi:hypothetical protein
VARDCLHAAPCPVVVVRSGDAAASASPGEAEPAQTEPAQAHAQPEAVHA